MWILCKVSSDPQCRITLRIEPLYKYLGLPVCKSFTFSVSFLSLLNVLRYSLLFSIMRYRNFYSCILSRYNYWIENVWWFPIQYCIPALLWDSCNDVLVFSCMALFICTKESGVNVKKCIVFEVRQGGSERIWFTYFGRLAFALVQCLYAWCATPLEHVLPVLHTEISFAQCLC